LVENLTLFLSASIIGFFILLLIFLLIVIGTLSNACWWQIGRQWILGMDGRHCNLVTPMSNCKNHCVIVEDSEVKPSNTIIRYETVDSNAYGDKVML
jgi:hypothetical protein